MRTFAVIPVIAAVSCMSSVCRGDALRDPTRPYMYDVAPPVTAQAKAEVSWHLSGVQIRGSSRSAILNGKLVREGDRIGTASVVKIEPWQVTLTEDYRQIVIKLLSGNVKQQTGANEHND